MKTKLLSLLLLATLFGCASKEVKEVTAVASFKGQQVTGVTVSDKGRIFANFPRWRKGVENSVVEVANDGSSTAFPNKEWNTWELGQTVSDSTFVAVQSVVAFENQLYVLDTRNPMFQGVIGTPRIFVFDLNTNKLSHIYTLSDDSFHQNSYINDLRVDKKKNKIYFTDSGNAGLVVLDMATGETKRVLDQHSSTLSEQDFLTFDDKKWNNTVHSDGIALDTNNNVLYYHALTGYSLYAISTDVLNNGNEKEIADNVQFIAKTSAPDGMIMDQTGNLYLGDLEHNKIMQFDTKTKRVSVLLEGDKVKWADTFSIFNNELYYTNSRINEAGDDISSMNFTIYKIKLD